MDNQIQEIKNKTDIVQLISGYVSLKKAGRNYKGLCPFHSEKTGSFMVSAERQIFKCFGCNEGGDAITFYQKIEGLEFAEALKNLADKVGVALKEYKTSPKDNQRETYTRINSLTAEFYHFLLTKHASGKKALEYLKARGLTEKTISDWQLGFAPDSWDTTVKYLLKKKVDPKDITASGIALPSTGKGAYDRFRKRITFPIRSISGTVVGFSGRILGDGEPKYLNSPDNILFNKSNNLFGLDKAKVEIKKTNTAVLVEGNLDVILSHQVGVTNVVCPLGTALTEKQIGLLRRFAENLVVGFDQDDSGQKAAIRAVSLAESVGINLKFASFDAKDPDELIRSRPKSWVQAIEDAEPVYDFLLSSLLKRYDQKDPGSIKKISQEFFPYLLKIDNELTRSHYERLLAIKLGVSEDSVRRELEKQKSSKEVGKSTEDQRLASNERVKVESYLVQLILQSGILPVKLSSEEFQVRQFRNILQLVEKQAKDEHFKLENIVPPEELEEVFDKLTLTEIDENILNSQSKTLKEIETCTLRIKELNLRTELKKASLSIRQAEIAQDETNLGNYSKKFQEYSVELARLEKQKEII